MRDGKASLYKNWTFWTVVISFLAVILSQLPPIRFWFSNAKLSIDIYSYVSIMHKVGKPQIQLDLILTNEGARAVTIKGITILVARDGHEIASLPAFNYMQNTTDKDSLIFTRFILHPQEEWTHIINFLNYRSREDEKNYREAEARLKQEIFRLGRLPENRGLIVKTGSSFSRPFSEMFDKNFVWLPGEYKATIQVDAMPYTARPQKSFTFTLFESDTRELTNSKADYGTGDGVYWDSGKHPSCNVPITEI
jgi:hypothetical protein